MNSSSLDKAKEILKATNYLVSIKGDKNKCTLFLPRRKMAPVKKPQTIHYEMLTGGGVNISGDADTYWICPEYVTRTSIWCDILKRCKDLEYNILGVHLYSDEIENGKSLLEIMDRPENSELEKELKVLELALILSEDINLSTLTELRMEAESQSCLDGFDFIVSNFAKGFNL